MRAGCGALTCGAGQVAEGARNFSGIARAFMRRSADLLRAHAPASIRGTHSVCRIRDTKRFTPTTTRLRHRCALRLVADSWMRRCHPASESRRAPAACVDVREQSRTAREIGVSDSIM